MWLSLLARAWVPVFALAAVLLLPPGAGWSSTYSLRWLAAGAVLIAAVGRKYRWAAVLSVALGAAGAASVAVDQLVRIAGGASHYRWLLVIGAAFVIGIAALQLRRIRHVDPVTAIAIQLATGLTVHWLYLQVSGLALDYRSYGKDTLQALGGTELSLLALAFAGVGLGVYRTWRPAVQRLGWSLPAWWQVVLGFFLAQLFLLSNYPAGLLTYLMMPKAYHAILLTYYHTFGGNPWWVFPIFAVIAGFGEETLFRGALQPKFGIVVTAVLFAVVHVQYGTTPILVMVFAHGLVYGLLRRYLNTTTSVIAHASYDLGAYLSPGFSADVLLAAACAALLVAPAWRHKRVIWRTLSEGFLTDWTRFASVHT